MKESVHRVEQNRFAISSFQPFLLPAILSVLIALGLYAYLGTFSRYSSDDYCLSAFYLQDTDFVSNMIVRYETSSSRYTNILFIGFADKVLGWYNPAILPPLMIAIFLFGLYLFLEQINLTARLNWSHWMSFYLAALLVYFSIVQSPNLYETLYWRAGMTSHFAPFAFLPLLGAFVLRQIRLSHERVPGPWVYLTCFIIPFLIGGLSEPPATLMITVLVLAIGAVWWWVKTPTRRSILWILSWTLAGALSALIVLALAPANSLRLGDTQPNVLLLVASIFSRTSKFAIDSVRTFPLPALISLVLPGLLFYIRSADQHLQPATNDRRTLIMLIPIVLLLGYLLIAAAFAPSVYGQSFPAARARFSGVLLLSCTFMITGAIMGILVAHRETKLSRVSLVRTGMLAAFVFVSLYPLRTAWRVAAEIPAYQQRAAAWDERDAYIRELKSTGVQDLTIPFLGDDVVQDLGDKSTFRLNRCASRMYGVNSILTLPMK